MSNVNLNTKHVEVLVFRYHSGTFVTYVTAYFFQLFNKCFSVVIKNHIALNDPTEHYLMFCCRIGYSALEPTDTPPMAEYTHAHIDAGVKHDQRVSIVVTNIFLSRLCFRRTFSLTQISVLL